MEYSAALSTPRDHAGNAVAAKVGQQAKEIYALLHLNGFVKPERAEVLHDQGSIAWALIRIALVQLRINDLQSASKLIFDTEVENVERRFGTTLKAVLDPELRQTSFAPIPRGPVPPQGARW